MAIPCYFPLEIKTFQTTQNPARKMAGASPSFLLLILGGKKKNNTVCTYKNVNFYLLIGVCVCVYRVPVSV